MRKLSVVVLSLFGKKLWLQFTACNQTKCNERFKYMDEKSSEKSFLWENSFYLISRAHTHRQNFEHANWTENLLEEFVPELLLRLEQLRCFHGMFACCLGVPFKLMFEANELPIMDELSKAPGIPATPPLLLIVSGNWVNDGLKL